MDAGEMKIEGSKCKYFLSLFKKSDWRVKERETKVSVKELFLVKVRGQ